jgi:hypothetical protein
VDTDPGRRIRSTGFHRRCGSNEGLGRRSDSMVGRGDKTTNRTLMAGGHEERHGRSSNTTDVGGLTQISPKKPGQSGQLLPRRRWKAGRRPEASRRLRSINAGKKGTRSRLRFGGPAYHGGRRRLRCSNLAAPSIRRIVPAPERCPVPLFSRWRGSVFTLVGAAGSGR